jgi:hypothetical protein
LQSSGHALLAAGRDENGLDSSRERVYLPEREDSPPTAATSPSAFSGRK